MHIKKINPKHSYKLAASKVTSVTQQQGGMMCLDCNTQITATNKRTKKVIAPFANQMYHGLHHILSPFQEI